MKPTFSISQRTLEEMLCGRRSIGSVALRISAHRASDWINQQFPEGPKIEAFMILGSTVDTCKMALYAAPWGSKAITEPLNEFPSDKLMAQLTLVCG